MFGLKLSIKESEYLTAEVNEAESIENNDTAFVQWKTSYSLDLQPRLMVDDSR